MPTHDLESFIEECAKRHVHWVMQDKDDVPTPITELWLWSDQGRLEVAGVIIRGEQGEPLETVHGDIPETSLPLDDEEDEFLEEFREAHDIDEDDLSWGDYDSLPEAIYRMEFIHCAKMVAEALKKNGLKFADNAKVGILIEDEDYDNPADFERKVKRGFGDMEDDAARALLALYYSNPEEKEHLLEI